MQLLHTSLELRGEWCVALDISKAWHTSLLNKFHLCTAIQTYLTSSILCLLMATTSIPSLSMSVVLKAQCYLPHYYIKDLPEISSSVIKCIKNSSVFFLSQTFFQNSLGFMGHQSLQNTASFNIVGRYLFYLFTMISDRIAHFLLLHLEMQKGSGSFLKRNK